MRILPGDNLFYCYVAITSNSTFGELYFITFKMSQSTFYVKAINPNVVGSVKFYKKNTSGELLIVRAGTQITYESSGFTNTAYDFITTPSDFSDYTEITPIV